ncbi:MAG: ABC transporter substrate-binding protein [Eubacteriales bacterium]|nr:ABC transporter substrate-binding protein [Eubacteriales bacterium]
MKRAIKYLCLFVAFSLMVVMFSACDKDAGKAGEDVVLEVVVTDPEYMAKEREIWDLYEEEHKNVKINLISVNEDQAAAFDARIAAGTPSDIMSKRTNVSKDDYQKFVNLQEIDYPYWDLFNFDIKNAFSKSQGISDNYSPVLSVWAGKYYSFLFYEDEMQKAGLDPVESVKSLDDLDKFLADLKAYVEGGSEFSYVFDIGWDSWFDGSVLLQSFAVALGFDGQDMEDVFMGNIRWDDVDKNPYAAAFKLLKEYYDKGYLPEKWWTRSWDKDYEPGFIAKKSILAFHGPWLWTKVLAANPDAKLSGFPLPMNEDGKIWSGASTAVEGACMFACNKDKPQYEETVKAFIWFNSPETVKLRSEALGLAVCMDLSEVGQPDLRDPQTLSIVKPFQEGVFGKASWESVEPNRIASAFKIKGTPEVLQDDAIAVEIGKYFEDQQTLGDFMKVLQTRWENSYDFSNK